MRRIVEKGRVAAWKRKRSQVLLKVDERSHGPGWSDRRIVEAFDVAECTVEKWRKQAVEQGPFSLLERKHRERPPTPRKLDGAGEARLVQLCCSAPPAGYARWSLKLLASTSVELEIVESISGETVRQVLKKKRVTTVAPQAVGDSSEARRSIRR